MTASPHDFDVFDCALDGVQLLEASAGTGKTWTLSGLVVRLVLEQGRDVRSILVVTFTNAATAELRDRIRSRLAETRRLLLPSAVAARAAAAAQGIEPSAEQRLLDGARARTGLTDTALALRLDAALAGFDEAAIHTIHGFCQRALGQIPFAAGLPMQMELVRDDSALRMAAINDFWRRRVAHDAIPEVLAQHLAAAGDCPERWAGILQPCLARPLARLRWPDALGQPAPDDRVTLHRRLAAMAPDLQALSAAFAAARAGFAQGPAPQAVLAEAAAREQLRKNVYKDELLAIGADEWRQWLAAPDPLRSPLARKLRSGRTRYYLSSCITQSLRKGAAVPQHPFFEAAETLAVAVDGALQALQQMRLALLRAMVDEVRDELARVKRERRVLGYDDLLRNLDDALHSERHPWLAATLRERYPVALIDEFQDTDPLQYRIFETIYRSGDGPPGPLVLVGDPKQAIYGFRNADLQVYLRARAAATQVHTLRQNQRSVAPLLQACNRLFGANAQAFIQPGLHYEPVAFGAKPRPPLHDDTEQPGGAALRLWWLPSGDGGEPLSAPAAKHAAASAAAAEIARLLAEARDGRITVGGRPLAPRGIAVLVRAHSQGRMMREALALHGVGSVELSQQSVFASPDADELGLLLQAVDEPGRNPRVLAALATALMGFDAEALAALAGDDTRMLAITAQFFALRETWVQRGVGAMLRQWMTDHRIDARLLARPDGERRLTNLLHLAELLQDASTQHPAPESLVRWFVEQAAAPEATEQAELRLESDENLVNIVTVHKSKGLEYDVVFCPFLWDAWRRPVSRSDVRGYHGDDGDYVLDFRPDAWDDADIGQRLRTADDAETMRLLYVALTRAVHRCYLTVGCYGKRSSSGAMATTESAGALLHWLIHDEATDYAQWSDTARRKARGAVQLQAAWQAFAQRCAPDIALLPWPAPVRAAPGLGSTGVADPLLSAAPPPARIPPAWRIGSFSQLAVGATHASADADHDAHTGPFDDDLPSAPGTGSGGDAGIDADAGASPRTSARASASADDGAGAAADDFLGFPRGPSAGDCMHAAFEAAEFGDPQSWPDAAQRALLMHPQALPGVPASEAQPRLARMLASALGHVLRARLPEGIVLAEVPPQRRLVELAFHLPAAGLTAPALNALLREHGFAAPRLAFAPLDGYLTGFIDLVFEQGGRWWIVDWKSNHLGTRADDYRPAALQDAMSTHGYALQALLYTVALHRWLGARLAGYDYDRHVGGALYVFARGVRPDWADAQGEAAGICRISPSRAVIEQLDALIGRGVPAGRSAAQAAPVVAAPAPVTGQPTAASPPQRDDAGPVQRSLFE